MCCLDLEVTREQIPPPQRKPPRPSPSVSAPDLYTAVSSPPLWLYLAGPYARNDTPLFSSSSCSSVPLQPPAGETFLAKSLRNLTMSLFPLPHNPLHHVLRVTIRTLSVSSLLLCTLGFGIPISPVLFIIRSRTPFLLFICN